ncbi:MAG: hypothetical protein IJO50_00485 [Clostridia bacterium]|nr:hypothetical protein [Clostridia bacterium]
MPELSVETVLNGEFMKNFESYATDQIPFREALRSVKAGFSAYVWQKMDNNGLYFADGHIAKLEYPKNMEMMDFAAEKFGFLYEQYLKDTDAKIYLSVVPDKNYFLAEQSGRLSLDYPAFAKEFSEKVPYMTYLDIMPLLSLDDYYRTDSHWKQESISKVAEFLADKMGTDATAEYEVLTANESFDGVYAGQLALPFVPDRLQYVTNETLANCIVTYYDTGLPKKGPLYDMEKAAEKDPYEMFLAGSQPLITIENPAADTDKELILFRDSFGSSLAPLLVEGYRNITVVDIRYIQSGFLGKFIEFSDQDVLFLYSASLLNNSTALR